VVSPALFANIFACVVEPVLGEFVGSADQYCCARTAESATAVYMMLDVLRAWRQLRGRFLQFLTLPVTSESLAELSQHAKGDSVAMQISGDSDQTQKMLERHAEHDLADQPLVYFILSFFGDKLLRKALKKLMDLPQRIAHGNYTALSSALPAQAVVALVDALMQLNQFKEQVQEVLDFGVAKYINQFHYGDLLHNMTLSAEVAIHDTAAMHFKDNTLGCALFLANSYNHLAKHFAAIGEDLEDFPEKDEKILRYQKNVNEYLCVWKWEAWRGPLGRLDLGTAKESKDACMSTLERFYNDLTDVTEQYTGFVVPDPQLATRIRKDVLDSVSNRYEAFLMNNQSVLPDDKTRIWGPDKVILFLKLALAFGDHMEADCDNIDGDADGNVHAPASSERIEVQTLVHSETVAVEIEMASTNPHVEPNGP